MKTGVRKQTLVVLLKFTPLVLFALLVILFKMDLLLAAPIATFCAIVVYMVVCKASFEQAFEQGLTSARKIIVVLFILMFAYGTAECFMATGVGAALINLALRLGVTARSVALVSMIVTCLLSIATGTSWGTFAACAPIFLWLNHLVGGSVLLTVCCIAGGSCFGDNVGMISDVTVLSCGMQDVKIIDRLKHQLAWAFGCLFLACGIVMIASISLPSTQGDVYAAIAQIPQEARDSLQAERPSALLLLEQVERGMPYYMIVPLILVIVLSFMGLHTLICLGVGMISSLFFGMFAGTVTPEMWLENLLLTGFSDAGSWTVVMMLWVSAFGGIMNSMNAFDPLENLVVRHSCSIRQLMGWCGVMCLAGNMALADETAQVTTISPIVRDIVDKNVECADEEANYTLRLRLATFTSAMGIYGSELVPWHCFPVFFASIANAVYPLHSFSTMEIIGKNYLSFIIVGSILFLTFTGWDRFVPGFGLPDKSRVKLRSNN